MTCSLLRRLTAVGTALLLLAALGGCQHTPAADSSAPAASTTASTTATTTTTGPKLGLNRLTGLEDMQTDNDRPIGFVVTDETATLVQLGLESADFYFEAETEGGIPRILAVYSSVDRIPEAIGPVRSARPHFVKFAKALDAIYCHIGGSASGLDTIKRLGVTELTNAYITHPVLKASKNFSWNRSAFTKEKVTERLQKQKIAVTSSYKSPYQFGSKSGSAVANTVNVQISESYHMAFTYDGGRGVYQKHRNTLDSPVHVTQTGGTIEAANVIVMYATRSVDETYTYGKDNDKQAVRYDFSMESGSGTLASGGTARDIRYTCTTAGLRFYESDGTTPLTVAPGKTYVCLAGSHLKNSTKIS